EKAHEKYGKDVEHLLGRICWPSTHRGHSALLAGLMYQQRISITSTLQI
ncbi:hypothetical protein AALP_AAs48402U000100, partial [Arabis alpina]